MTSHTDIFQSVDLKRKHLHEQIADSIQDLIASNQLQPGKQLPSERDLANRLGVSRNTVREAIRSLEQRGLLMMRPGSGTFVTEVAPEVVADSIERYFAFSSCSHEDLVKLREILEPEVAALAAEHSTSEDLARLKNLVEEMENAFSRDDVERYAATDTNFHVALALASHNELIIAITSGLQQIMRVWIEAQSKTFRLEKGAFSHRAVCEAIAARSPDRAREAMRVHMSATRSALLE
ncbi:MAG: FadR/GntR family transcriptional regulator [Chloroflexota bacterium]